MVTQEQREVPNTRERLPSEWEHHVLSWRGGERRYLSYIPDSFAAEGDSVVIFAHGYGDNARSLSRSLPIDEWATEYGFAAVVPFADRNPEAADGGRTSWNAGVCCAFGDPTRDDLGMIEHLVTQFRSEHPSRELGFYLIGFSNGGFLAETIACRHPDWFRGVSSVGGSLSTNQLPCAAPSESVRVHRVTGSADQRILHAGGTTPLGRYASFEDDLQTWGSNLACPDLATETVGVATCQSGSCEGGAVRFCLVDGLRHQWPTSPALSYDAFDDAWQFWTE